eukprot:1749066-Rhodomonas_salina.1
MKTEHSTCTRNTAHAYEMPATCASASAYHAGSCTNPPPPPTPVPRSLRPLSSSFIACPSPCSCAAIPGARFSSSSSTNQDMAAAHTRSFSAATPALVVGSELAVAVETHSLQACRCLMTHSLVGCKL